LIETLCRKKGKKRTREKKGGGKEEYGVLVVYSGKGRINVV